jgi:hypothetical protein
MSANLRQQKFNQVSTSLGQGAGFRSDQGAIWEELEQKSARLGVSSATGAMKDIFDRYHVSDSKLKKRIAHQENQVGLLAFIRDGFAGGDLFATEKLSKRQLYKLVRSYHVDTLDESLEFPKISAETVIQRLNQSSAEKVKTPGLGTEMRFQEDQIQGSAILLDDEVAHVTLLPRVESKESHRCWWQL